MLTRNEAGQLCVFGLHIVGGWFPWMGWRRETISAELIPDAGHTSDVLCETLSVEWFGVGLTLFVEPV